MMIRKMVKQVQVILGIIHDGKVDPRPLGAQTMLSSR